MRGSGSVPDLHVLGLILNGPHCSSFNEKDERGAGWENTQPSSFPSTTPFTLLLVPFVQPSLALPGPPATNSSKTFLLQWGKSYCNKLGVRLVSILNFSGIIPSDLMCKFLPILYFFVFWHCGSTIVMFKL